MLYPRGPVRGNNVRRGQLPRLGSLFRVPSLPPFRRTWNIFPHPPSQPARTRTTRAHAASLSRWFGMSASFPSFSGNVCDATFEVVVQPLSPWYHHTTIARLRVSRTGMQRLSRQTLGQRGTAFPALCRGRIPRIADYVRSCCPSPPKQTLSAVFGGLQPRNEEGHF